MAVTLDSMKKNRTSLSDGVKALWRCWEKCSALQDQYMNAVECCSALRHLPGLMQFVFVNDGWRGGETVTKTALYLMQMSWREVCMCGGVGGGNNENDQFST